MSTRSNIYLRLKPATKTRTVKFDVNKLPQKKRATCTLEYPIKDLEIPANATYIGVYHHWDGYIAGLGEELQRHYKSYKRVLNLLSMGSFSTILETVNSYQGMDGEPPRQIIKYDEELTPKESLREEYAYLFDGKKWWVTQWKYDDETNHSYIMDWEELAPAVVREVAARNERIGKTKKRKVKA